MKKALRLAYDDRQSTFEDLLNIDNSVTIHHRKCLLQNCIKYIINWPMNV